MGALDSRTYYPRREHPMHTRFAAGAAALAVAIAWGVPTAQAQYVAGDFTYQFADPLTGVPITNLLIPTTTGSAKVAVYLLQTGHTSTPAFSTFGMDGLGVRLNYANITTSGGILHVVNTLNANISQRPPPTNNPNGVSTDYTNVQRYGVGTTTTPGATDGSAAISEGLINSDDPVPVPGNGNEDPLHNNLRMLIGTFTLTGVANGTENVTAVSGPVAGGTNSLTGPDPSIIGPRNDGTTGLLPGTGATSILIDPLLSSTIPTLAVTVGVPEPSTMALCGLTAAGLAAWRRKRRTVPVAA
jgi:hypothetical protein